MLPNRSIAGLAIHRKAPVRRIGPLLLEPDAPVLIHPELVPANTTAPASSGHGMHPHDRLPVSQIPVHQPRHDFVTLRVQALVGTGLGHTIGELAVT